MRVRLDRLVDLLGLVPDLLLFLYLHDLQDGVVLRLLGRENQQILRLAVLQEVDESYFFVFRVANVMPQQLEDMLTMVVSNEAVAMLVSDYQSLFLELVSVTEADEAPLGKAEVVDAGEVVLELEGQVFFLVELVVVGVQVFVVEHGVVLLHQVLEGAGLLRRRQRRRRCVHHKLLLLQHFLCFQHGPDYDG